MQRQPLDLEGQIGDLREELRYLRSEVSKLRGEVRVVQAGAAVTELVESANSESSVAAGSYAFVEEESSAAGRRALVGASVGGSSAAGVGVGDRGEPEQAPIAPSYPRPLTWSERERICDRIAQFLLRALQGDHRGPSGRDEIHLSSRLWIVARSFEGQCFRPLRVFRRFGDCKLLVKRGSDLGSSVFIGVPSERDGRRIAQTSGLGWPEDY